MYKNINDNLVINSVDYRGYYICIKGRYLYHDGQIRGGAEASSKSTAFWDTQEDAVDFYIKWKEHKA